MTSSTLCLIILALPHFIFFAGWLHPAPGIGAAVLLLWLLHRARSPSNSQKAAPREALALLVGAAAIVSISGIGGFGLQNTDHIASQATLKALVEENWPLMVHPDRVEWLSSAKHVIYYFGFFLPAAAVGKLHPHAANPTLALTAWVLLSLIFWQIWRMCVQNPNEATLRKQIALMCAFLLFGGFDLIGWIVTTQSLPKFQEHIEWWGQLFQFSSHTTQLLWVPQQSLAAWLATFVSLRDLRSPQMITPPLPLRPLLCCALLPLWSPFAAVGLTALIAILWIPRFLASTKTDPTLRSRHIAHIVVMATLCALATLPQAIFLLSNDFRFPVEWLPATHPFTDFAKHWLLFVGLEIAPWIALLLSVHKCPQSRKDVLWVGSTLAALLLVKMGEFNDFAMRASIPPLAFLCVSSLEAGVQSFSTVRSPGPHSRLIPIACCVVLLLGAGAPILEWQRSLKQFSISVDEWESRPTLDELRPPLFIDQRIGQIPHNLCSWLYRCNSDAN